jgi:uncharacterized protein (TIGR03792 family)
MNIGTLVGAHRRDGRRNPAFTRSTRRVIYPWAMVVEFLTFVVPAEERTEWLEIEEQHWSRFLERQPGFVRKEIWVPEVHLNSDDSSTAHLKVHAVIWWESLEAWQAIPQDQLDAVAQAMGPHERAAVCETFTVQREG